MGRSPKLKNPVNVGPFTIEAKQRNQLRAIAATYDSSVNDLLRASIRLFILRHQKETKKSNDS